MVIEDLIEKTQGSGKKINDNDDLGQCFSIGICAYNPEVWLFVKCAPARYIWVELKRRTAYAHRSPYNAMLHSYYEQPLNVSEEDMRLAEQLIEGNRTEIETDFAEFDKEDRERMRKSDTWMTTK